MICDDCTRVEKKIIHQFKEIFVQRTDIGTEYFEGNYSDMIYQIFDIITTDWIVESTDDWTDAAEEQINASALDNYYEYVLNKCKCTYKCICEWDYPFQEYYDDYDSYSSVSNDETSNVYSDDDDETSDVEYEYTVDTAAEWFKFSKLKVIVTSKTGNCYIKSTNRCQPWIPIIDRKNQKDFVDGQSEDLLTFIEHNSYGNVCIHKKTNKIVPSYLKDLYYKCDSREYYHSDVTFNHIAIYKDIIKKCYTKTPSIHKLKYHEYLFHVMYDDDDKDRNSYIIFDSKKFTFTKLNDAIDNNTIIYEEYCRGIVVRFREVNNSTLVDKMFDSLIAPDIKHKYKKLVYNILVSRSDEYVVFYDSDSSNNSEGYLLTHWIKNLVSDIYGYYTPIIMYSTNYYKDKKTFKKIV